MGAYKYLMIHCTASIEGRKMTPEIIERMHMGARVLSDGRIQYKGKKYRSKSDLPDEVLGGLPANKTRGRGWDRVGYSKMFMEDGSVHTFVDHNEDNFIDHDEMTWGAKGMNSVTKHFVYAGGLSKETYVDRKGRTKHYHRNTMTTLQEISLIKAVKKELKKHPDIKLIGHNQVAKKSCPCFDVRLWSNVILIPENRVDQRKLMVTLMNPLF